MRYALAVIACLLIPTIAEARVPGQCAHLGHVACGCTASVIAFGRPMAGLNAVSNWHKFSRTSPHPGAAAIWPGRHVEIVTAVNGDGTVSTTGSVGFSHVPINRLVFVEPGNGAVGNTMIADVPRHQRTHYAARHGHAMQVAYDGSGAWL